MSNFGFSNKEIDPKIGIYVKNWARQVLLENFDFWSRFMQKSTFWKLDSLHNFWVSNKETDSKIGMYVKNWVGQASSENFDFLVKVKGPLGQSFFFYFFILFFFLSQAVRTRSDIQVGPGQTEVVEDDIIHDVIALGVCVSAWRVTACEGSAGTWLGIWTWNFQVWWIEVLRRFLWCRFCISSKCNCLFWQHDPFTSVYPFFSKVGCSFLWLWVHSSCKVWL